MKGAFDVYIINLFRFSHTLQRNLTKLVYVQKEKNPKLKKSICLRYFMEKNHEILKCKFKYGFSIVLRKKLIFSHFKQKKVF